MSKAVLAPVHRGAAASLDHSAAGRRSPLTPGRTVVSLSDTEARDPRTFDGRMDQEVTRDSTARALVADHLSTATGAGR